jgi:TRAP-type C4-dicarboxylate transport system permease small subunit
MSALQRLNALAARLSAIGEFASNVALLLMTLGITADVLMRWLVGSASKAAVELTGYLMVMVVYFGLGPTQRARAHIQIDLLVRLLPAPMARAIALVNSILFLFYAVALAALGWKSVSTSYFFGTTSRTGLDVIVWPFQLFIPVGLAILIVVLLAEILSGGRTAGGPKPAAAIHD